ncbi:MAG: NAD(P) transhydrogenase subunit alpha, partial [Dehalococcoidia bacterium]|nr:NAD(P) transhydrogenase subunit alpha [Dehalococcoidia bacterium]
ESVPGEQRVALTPAVISILTKLGVEVLIEPGAGAAAGFPDDAYTEQGARLAANRDDVLTSADVLARVRGIGASADGGQADLAKFKSGQIVVGLLDPLGNTEAVQSLAGAGVTSFALELLPRITRAQSMDVLSSQATVAGYKAVIQAANMLNRMYPLMMTAAGTITPAHVLVVGAGVAGLQAIATARRLGSVVQAYDVRPASREQVESLGARFVELELETADAEGAGGYAEALGDDFYRKQGELMAKLVSDSDVVISTAAVPGAKAPILISADAVRGMRPGSVIFDLAAETGGNCELTSPGETIETDGVTIVGTVQLATEVPHDASQMYARNVAAFLGNLIQDGAVNLNLDDEIIRGTLLTHGGEVVADRVRGALGLTTAESE